MKQRRATIRRIIIRASIFLLLGAILNVAVAWGCRVADPSTYVDGSYMHSKLIDWFTQSAPSPPEFPWIIDYAVQWDGVGYRESWVTAGSPWDESWDRRYGMPTRRYIQAKRFEVGWPTLALEGALWIAYDISRERVFGPNEYLYWNTLQWSPDWSGSYPVRPVWPGFAINTLFYAAILWLLFAAPFKLRRWRRIKGGLCPACAYPVGTSNLCTECGKPVKARSVEPASS